MLCQQQTRLAAAFASWDYLVACSGAVRHLLQRVLLGALRRAFVAWR